MTGTTLTTTAGTEPTTDPTSVRRRTWETYASSWKAETAAEKEALFATSLSPRCVYTDPLTRAEGWPALLTYMLDFHRQIPGGHFVTRSFRWHHDHGLAHWNMVSGDGSVVGDGVSHARFGADGRLVAMTGFFDAAG